VRDAHAAWKQGIPAVLLIHPPFTALAKAQCQMLGATDPTVLVYAQDAPARESDADLDAKAKRVAGEIIQLLSS
jgi:hypothetical protein